MWRRFRLQSTSLLLLSVIGAARAVVSNDRCVNATEISPGDFVVGTVPELPPNFDAGDGGNDLELLSCADGQIFQVESPGLWYYYRADTNRDLRVSSCANETNFDNRITVFVLEEGTCLDRRCIGSSVGDQDDCLFSQGTSVSFSTSPGLYAFFVHGEFLDSFGDFGMSLFDQSKASDGASCETAIGLSSNETLQGTTVGAEYHSGLLCDRCIEGGPANPGVFYTITPVPETTGISISIAGANGRLFDVRVYSGKCGELVCKKINETTEGNQLTGSFLAEADETYHVYVSAADEDGGEVTDRFGILMIQEKKDPSGNGGSAASTSLVAYPLIIGLTSLMYLFG